MGEQAVIAVKEARGSGVGRAILSVTPTSSCEILLPWTESESLSTADSDYLITAKRNDALITYSPSLDDSTSELLLLLNDRNFRLDLLPGL